MNGPPEQQTALPFERADAKTAATTTTITKDSRRKPTQLDTVLRMLRNAEAVCSTTFLAERIPRAAALVHKLRSNGHSIITRPCLRGHHHEHPQIEYSLEALPVDPNGGAT